MTWLDQPWVVRSTCFFILCNWVPFSINSSRLSPIFSSGPKSSQHPIPSPLLPRLFLLVASISSATSFPSGEPPGSSALCLALLSDLAEWGHHVWEGWYTPTISCQSRLRRMSMKKGHKVSQKVKDRIIEPYNWAIPLLGIYPEVLNNLYMHVYSSTLHNSKRWTNQIRQIHTIEYYSVTKKKKKRSTYTCYNLDEPCKH